MIELKFARESFAISGRHLAADVMETLSPMVETSVRILENVATAQNKSSVEPERLVALQAVMMKIDILLHEAQQISEQGIQLSSGELSATEAGFPEFDPKSPLYGAD